MSRRVRTEVTEGFVWEDDAGHVVACGDATDRDFVRRLVLEYVDGPADLALVDPPYNISKEERIVLEGRKSLYLDEDWDKYADADFARLLGDIVAVATDVAPAGNWWFWTSDWWLSEIKRWMRDALEADRSWPSYHWCKPNPAPSIRKANPSSARR
jgi:DNA modification methylase